MLWMMFNTQDLQNETVYVTAFTVSSRSLVHSSPATTFAKSVLSPKASKLSICAVKPKPLGNTSFSIARARSSV